jgi:5-formyltetrahydrofolate cyclo-ligase
LKRRFRKQLLQKRDSIPPEEKKRKDKAVLERLCALEEFKEAKSILLYVSFRSEVDTGICLKHIIALGKKLVLPVVDAERRALSLYETRDTSELRPGYMGIPEPEKRPDRKVTLKGVDLVIIPGVGFDVSGGRLGYGGGYYDRLLGYESKRLAGMKRHIVTLALAYEEQIGREIPAERHDIKVDMIVTDMRLIRCAK